MANPDFHKHRLQNKSKKERLVLLRFGFGVPTALATGYQKPSIQSSPHLSQDSCCSQVYVSSGAISMQPSLTSVSESVRSYKIYVTEGVVKTF
jgi:hypothetical protein